MKTILLEGFETFGNLAGLQERYPTNAFTGTPNLTRGRYFGTSFGRLSGDAGFNLGSWRKEGFGVYASAVVGQSLFIAEPDANAYMLKFFRAGAEQARVNVVDDGAGNWILALEVNGVELRRTEAIPRDDWRHVEIAFLPHPTEGKFAVWVERELILEAEQLEAAAAGTDGIDAVEWAFNITTDPTSLWAIDDVYLAVGDGSDWQETLGPILVVGALMESDGTREEWTPSSGTNSAALVSEVTDADDDTTYVAAQGVGKADLFLPASLHFARRAPIAVQLETRARLTQAGAFGRLEPIFRQGGVEATGTEEIDVPATSYANAQRVFPTNPVTSAPWELGDVVGPSRAEVGVQTSV